jgi:hypothetical protein
MSIEVYPSAPRPSFSKIIDESFNTIITRAVSGVEERNRIARFPDRAVLLAYKVVEDAGWPAIHSFFRKRLGAFEPFWFFDFNKRLWVDEFVGVGGLIPLIMAVADDGGSQTDETIEANDDTASDMTLLPAAPEVDDAYYFLSNWQFDTIRLNIGIQGAGTWTIAWEYWDGSAWAALSNVTDGTSGFKAAAGNHDVTFDVPANWAITEVSGINGYAVRARVSAFTSISTQPKGTQAWISSKTFELPSKETTNDTSLVTYIDGVATAKTFVSGGGAGGADRIAFSSTPADGSLITSDSYGYLRILGRLDDKFRDEYFTQGEQEGYSKFESIKINEIRQTLTP